MPTRPALAVNPPALSVLPDLPPVSALFLIEFDVKAGYTVTWKQAIAGLELEGVVEYKSLPSGLHTVSEDLIYFIHEGGYAGLSAFVNAPTEEEGARHARMIAVGVLVPLSYGRLGRSWRHAEGLREMAEKLAADPKDTSMLERYWTVNRAPDATASIEPLRDSPLSSPTANFTAVMGKGHSRKRSASDGNALIAPGHRLSPFHPAWSLTALLDTFGPLIFPIHRAALLRKRILISTHAPVHTVCDYVYDISVLSNIPLSLFEMLGPTAPSQRLRPLFTIGVHDIPQRRGSGVSGSASGPLAKAGAGGQGLGMADSVMSLAVHRTPDGRTVSGASDVAPGEALQQVDEGEAASSDEERARVELTIIAYFRRLTTQIIAVVADIVESGDDDDDDDDEDDRDEDLTGGDSEPEDTGLLNRGEDTGSSMNNNRDDGLDGSVSIDSDALTRMGLDMWSNGDVAFVKEVTALYFSRRAKVESKCVEVCGLRVC
ncbi:hypothetical protein MAPG_03016 [Magnaporthiopsis poae ATCC 64411]|uniref:DUF4484 domain-containing protein n=1 Tax=Magnaporthiopsis poae (strain ATCC 64411 / 73-15) TaxID=644358 RepID=A0A0C4DSX2_MAGP6|nr:hypothetical protein MAPG_03016 [Magnaporthiopsis poae ATCC 64411]